MPGRESKAEGLALACGACRRWLGESWWCQFREERGYVAGRSGWTCIPSSWLDLSTPRYCSSSAAVLKIRFGNYCVKISISISYPKCSGSRGLRKYEFKVDETTIHQVLSSITGKATCCSAFLPQISAAHFSRQTGRLVTSLQQSNATLQYWIPP